MRFDLFHELSVPEFLHTSREVIDRTLALWEQADRLGYGTAWLVEHHLMPEFSHSTAPDLVLAAASQRTERLRLGLGVVPLPYHHPLRVAQRVGMLDQLSGGRLDLGIGRGFSPREYATFGAEMSESARGSMPVWMRYARPSPPVGSPRTARSITWKTCP